MIMIVDRLNSELKVNDLVLFYQTKVGLLRGIVTKINKKTVTVNPLPVKKGEPNEYCQDLYTSHSGGSTYASNQRWYWLPQSFYKAPYEVVKIGYALIDEENHEMHCYANIGDEEIWN